MEMDVKLTKVACQRLQIFIAVWERPVKLRESKLVKAKIFSSTFFLGSNTIGPRLQEMKILVEKERGLVQYLASISGML
jgi:hypothetical protein